MMQYNEVNGKFAGIALKARAHIYSIYVRPLTQPCGKEKKTTS